MHARSAAIGVATAHLYPNVLLTGAMATAALTPAALFGSSSGVWSLAAGMTQPIFHGGALEAKRRETIEAYQASLATYRETVLVAFGQVADTLRALDHDAALVRDERQALQSAGTALQMQRLRYAVGRSDVLQLLDAERSLEQVRLGYARAVAQRYIDSARLFVAMGGGGWREGKPNK